MAEPDYRARRRATSGLASAAWRPGSSRRSAPCFWRSPRAPSPRRVRSSACARRSPTVRFVAYTPRGFDPNAGAAPVEAAAIRADLALLRPPLRRTGDLLERARARRDPAHRARARASARSCSACGIRRATPSSSARSRAPRAEPGVVLALALGNEGLFFERYDPAALARAFARARREAPGVAVTTTRAVLELPRRDARSRASRAGLPAAHRPPARPALVRAPRRRRRASTSCANVVRELESRTALPVLVKETGTPSGPAAEGFNESSQAEFWAALAAVLPPTREHAFVWFEAFDAPWKIASVAAQTGHVRETEAHWGLYRADGSAEARAREASRDEARRPRVRRRAVPRQREASTRACRSTRSTTRARSRGCAGSSSDSRSAKGERVLEVGCGTANVWRENAERVPSDVALVLTDLSPGMLGEARARLSGTPLAPEFREADAQSLPFADESFDLVVANHMLYHVPDRARALAEIRARAAPRRAAARGHESLDAPARAARAPRALRSRGAPARASARPERVRPRDRGRGDRHGARRGRRGAPAQRARDPHGRAAASPTCARWARAARLPEPALDALARHVARQIELQGALHVGIEAGVVRAFRRA